MQPQRPRRGKCAGPAVALALLLSAVPEARAEGAVVYRWLDAEGVAHYTTQEDRIPSEFSDSVQEIRRGSGAESTAARPSATTPPGSSSIAPAPVAAPTPESPPPTPSVSTPPPSAAPAPIGPRVVPEGEFEEPPLGSRSAVTPEPAPRAPDPPTPPIEPPQASAPVAATQETPSVGSEPTWIPAPPMEPSDPPVAAAPAPTPSPDVAAPPPSLLRGPGAPAARAASAPPAAAPPATEPAPPLTPESIDALDQRIASLETQIGRDQVALQGILSEPPAEGGPRIAERPDFRELAARLPQLQADLKSLRQQRAGANR